MPEPTHLQEGNEKMLVAELSPGTMPPQPMEASGGLIGNADCEAAGNSMPSSDQERRKIAMQGPTLIFDGVCNLCNASMRWYLDRLRSGDDVYLMWAQHKDTQPLLEYFGISHADIMKSWAYVEDSIVYRGSSAWFRAMKHLRQPWNSLQFFSAVPSVLREGAYSVVSKTRYSVLGKTDDCQAPPPGMAQRFLHNLDDTRVADPSASSSSSSPASQEHMEQKRLIIVGCGPAGLAVARAVAYDFQVIVVEPKDYYEFTPGILRGFANPDHMQHLQVGLDQVFKDIPVELVRGEVINMYAHSVDVRRLSTGSLEGNGLDADVVSMSFDLAVVAAGSQYAGSGLWKVTGAPGEEQLLGLNERNGYFAQHNQEIQELRRAGGTAILVGAGLVGVELAAELAYYMPGLKIVLADLADRVLPAMPAAAQDYARRWLQDYKVELRLGQPLERGKEAESLGIEGPSIVYGCAGVRMRNSFMTPLNCLDERGAIRVNHAMQVLSNTAVEEDVRNLGPDRAHVVGAGRVFALGDCVSLQGASAPLAREIYPAEAAAEVIVKNLRAAKIVQCLRTCRGVLSELREPLNAFTICSLGPEDAVMVGNGSVWFTGWRAAFMKGQIESSKMSQYRNEMWGNLVWALVPHW